MGQTSSNSQSFNDFITLHIKFSDFVYDLDINKNSTVQQLVNTINEAFTDLPFPVISLKTVDNNEILDY